MVTQANDNTPPHTRSRLRTLVFYLLTLLIVLSPLLLVELALRLFVSVPPPRTEDPYISFTAMRPLFELDGVQFLINRLPGYMVRSMPGRLWVRVSREGRARGLTLHTVAQALTAAYVSDFDEVEGLEILFVTSSLADVEMLAPIALEAAVVSGRHKKLVLSAEGDLECSELGCETCEEKPVCDDLREIVRQRRGKS